MRAAILVTAIITGLAAPSIQQSSCPTFVVRKEVRSMTSSEWNAFVSAVRTLNSGAQPTLWNRMSDLHNQLNTVIHGVPVFLPWHRLMLYHMEWLLRRVNPSVTIPYWDWGRDAGNPTASAVLSSAYYGGNGRSGDRCVTNGAFANWRVQYPNPRCLRRAYARGSTTGPFVDNTIVQLISDRTNDYNRFRQDIEQSPHGVVHVGIGGDMETMFSPNDPLFYAHHANVDRIWSNWQKRSLAHLWAYNGSGNADLSDTIPGYDGWIVQDVMDHINTLCYDYAPPGSRSLARRQNGRFNVTDPDIPFIEQLTDTLNTVLAPNARASSNNEMDIAENDARRIGTQIRDYIRQPDPLPERHIIMQGFTVASVRALERGMLRVTAKINTARRSFLTEN